MNNNMRPINSPLNQPVMPVRPNPMPNMIPMVQQEIQEISTRIPKEQVRTFGSLKYRPNVKFKTQDPDEHVFILIRTHWITNLGWIFRTFLFSLFYPAVLFILEFFTIELTYLTQKDYIIVGLIFYSYILTNSLSSFFDWYYDIQIVTNKRIMDYDFKPFTNYNIIEASLHKIEDVKEKSSGFLPNMFNFGDIIVRTASETGQLDFTDVPNPSEVRDVIVDISNITKKYHHGD